MTIRQLKYWRFMKDRQSIEENKILKSLAKLILKVEFLEIKKLILPSLMLFFTFVCFAQSPTNKIIKIIIGGYSPEELNAIESFNIYYTPSLDTTPVNWQILTNTISTNNIFSMVPSKMFFTATASNFWGESDFLVIVSTPNPTRSVTKLTIEKIK